MGWLRKRFGEASTHAGLATLFAVGSVLVPPQYQLLLQAVAGAFGVGAVAVPEGR